MKKQRATPGANILITSLDELDAAFPGACVALLRDDMDGYKSIVKHG